MGVSMISSQVRAMDRMFERMMGMTGQSLGQHEQEMKEARVLEDPLGLTGASALLPVPVHEVYIPCVTTLSRRCVFQR